MSLKFFLANWFSLLLLFLLILVFLYFLLQLIRGLQSLSWRKAKGKILQSEVKKERSYFALGEIYHPKLQYEYWAKGKRHVGKRMMYTHSLQMYYATTQSDAFEMIKAYRVEDEIEVYYNWNKPWQSVLIRGVPRLLYIYLATFGAIILIMFAVLFPNILMPRRYAINLATLLIILAWIGILLWKRFYLKARMKAIDWRKTKGNIISTNIDKTIQRGYYTTVIYEYTVDEKAYQNNVISDDYQRRLRESRMITFGSKRKAKKIAKKYPVNLEVDIYYNPKDPQEALLEQGKRKWKYYKYIILIAIIGAGMIPWDKILRK